MKTGVEVLKKPPQIANLEKYIYFHPIVSGYGDATAQHPMYFIVVFNV